MSNPTQCVQEVIYTAHFNHGQCSQLSLLAALNCEVFLQQLLLLLHFARVVDDGKMYSGHGRLCVCRSLTAFPHYCTDRDVNCENATQCPLVVHYWVDLQSVNGFHCYDNIAPNARCQRVLVLALCLVTVSKRKCNY